MSVSTITFTLKPSFIATTIWLMYMQMRLFSIVLLQNLCKHYKSVLQICDTLVKQFIVHLLPFDVRTRGRWPWFQPFHKLNVKVECLVFLPKKLFISNLDINKDIQGLFLRNILKRDMATNDNVTHAELCIWEPVDFSSLVHAITG